MDSSFNKLSQLQRDLLREAPMVEPEKREIEGIRIDSLREIAANKICTLVGRNACG